MDFDYAQKQQHEKLEECKTGAHLYIFALQLDNLRIDQLANHNMNHVDR